MRARSSLATVVVALAAAAPAHASVTIGRDLTQAPTLTESCAHPACMYSVTSVGDASPIDGVVTSWSERSEAGLPAKMRPRVVRLGTGTSYTAVSNGARTTITTTGVQTFATRLRIATGDNFAVEVGDPAANGTMTTPTMFGTSGAGGTGIWDPSPADDVLTASTSGSSTNVSVSARIEPDADGDGYGDETQDPCPADAVDHVTPCGAVTIGTPMFPRGASAGAAGCSGAKCLWFDPDVTAPGAGVITRVRTYGSSPGGTYRLRTLTLAPGRTTAAAHALSAESGTFGSAADPFLDAYAVTIPTRLAIAAGDRFAIEDVTAPGHGVQFERGATGHTLSDAAAVPDAPGSVAVTSADDELLFAQADIEPDIDNDGYGDSTQDVCPLDSATHDRPCTADLALSRGLGVAILVFPGNPAPTPAIQLVNNGPVDATRTVVTMTPPAGAKLVTASSSTGACLVAVTVTCTVGTLPEGGHGNARRQHDHQRAGSVPDRRPRVQRHAGLEHRQQRPDDHGDRRQPGHRAWPESRPESARPAVPCTQERHARLGGDHGNPIRRQDLGRCRARHRPRT